MNKGGKVRNKKEIEKVIEELKKERRTLPPYSKFGDPNWEIIDTQVNILEKVLKEKLDELDIEKKLDNLLDVYDGNFPEETVPLAIVHAYDWLLENIEELV